MERAKNYITYTLKPPAYMKWLAVLPMVLLLFTCNHPSQMKPVRSPGEEKLYKAEVNCQRLLVNAKYDSLIIEGKKVLLQANALNNKKAIAYLCGIIGDSY